MSSGKKKTKKKSTPFYGITPTEKAKAQGLSMEQFKLKTDVNIFRSKKQREYFKAHATGEKDSNKRSKIMSESWKHANNEANKKYGPQIKASGLKMEFMNKLK